MAERHIDSFYRALHKLNLSHCAIFLTQNDGTLIDSERAKKFPVLTFSSGATNSLRGASKLVDLQDAIIVDIGGTSTDVSMVSKGFPRQASAYVKIGGVRTNFRMPDTISIGLGGGSLVKFHQNGTVSVGPQSVGYKLKSASVCFGGDVLTTTDIAIASGIAEIEGADASRVK